MICTYICFFYFSNTLYILNASVTMGAITKSTHIASSDGRTMPLFGSGYFDIGADNL